MLRTASLSVLLLATTAALAAPAPVPSHDPVVLGAPTAWVTYPLPFRTTTAQSSWEREVTMLNLINNERAAAGLTPLMPHATIRSVARAHGLEMFAFGYLSHVDRSGLGPQQRVLRRGVRVRIVGENIAYAGGIREAHEALMASEAHRQNILLPDYRLVGIGVIDGGPYGVVVVENFGH